MPITIVPMTEDHIARFHATLDVVARERKYLAFLEAPPLESTRTFVLGNLAKGAPQFVAIDGDDVVGWCDITPIDRPIYAHCGTLGMGLLPSYRGKGHGLTLIEAALAEAGRFGLTRVELTVHASNARAYTLYERVGFQREGVKRKAVCIDGMYEDVIFMARLGEMLI